MLTRFAACVCGQLTASCSGDPVQVSLCHCFACQRRTGSTYGIAAFFPRESVVVAGHAKAYTRSSDNGYAVTFFLSQLRVDCILEPRWQTGNGGGRRWSLCRSGVPGAVSGSPCRTPA
jgi:Glutathione-dependent formaldehyde-activating enzyme